MKPTGYSDSFKVFIGLNAVLVLISLFCLNATATLWNGAESSQLLFAQAGTAHSPATLLTAVLYNAAGLNLFLLRLPDVLTLLLTALLFFTFGKKIFGKDAVVLTLLIAASSFVLLPIAKFGGADVYLLLAQLLHLVFTILFLKQPVAKWRYSSFAFLLLGMLIHPLAMAVWGAVAGLLLGWLHPQRSYLRQLYLPVGLALLLIPLLAHRWWGDWQFPEFTFSFGQLGAKNTFVILLLSVLPWLGFLPAALVDLYKKIKTKEELAIVICTWLAGAILSQSLSVVFVLSFMIAKQVWFVMQSGYPYLRLVKAFTLLNLIAIFIIVFMALFGGISWVGAEAYRPLLGTAFVYWVFSFLGVLGLFLKDRRVVIGGFVFSGVVAMLLFWISIYPYWESYRALPKIILQKAADKNGSGVAQLVVYPAEWTSDNFKVYAKEIFSKVSYNSDSLAFKTQMAKPNHQIFVFDNKVLTEVDSTLLKSGAYLPVPGGWGRMGSGVWLLGGE